MPRHAPSPFTSDLFSETPAGLPHEERLGAQTLLLRGFVLPFVEELLPALAQIKATAPSATCSPPAGSRCRWR